MITVTNLSKNYGKKTLFENISLNINKGEKVGLIGPNGSGKTTLFALILGEIEPSKGNIQVNKNTNIGYLPQESGFSRPDIKVPGGIPPEAGKTEFFLCTKIAKSGLRYLSTLVPSMIRPWAPFPPFRLWRNPP